MLQAVRNIVCGDTHDEAMVWPKLDYCFEVFNRMGTPGVSLATKLESVSSADYITEITKEDKVALAKECTGICWSAVAGRFACSDKDIADMSGQSPASQVITGTIALGIVHGSSNLQVALGDANVCVEVTRLLELHISTTVLMRR